MANKHDARTPMSDSERYLTHVLSSYPKLNKSFWVAYNGMRMNRFLFSTGIAFLIQYVTLIHLTFTYPTLPINPAMGTAFVMLYLLGNMPVLGLFLGGFAAYFLNGLTVSTLFLYLTADLGCSYLGVQLCQSVFSSDHAVYTNSKEALRFVIINACTSCFLSSLLRTVAVLLFVANPLSFKAIGYNWINFWLADLNAIIVFSGFFFTWIGVYLGREAILHKNISKHHALVLGILIISGALLIKKAEFIIIATILSLYLSYCYGVLVATASSYIMTTIFLMYFMVHQQACLDYFGIQLYTLIPCVLLFFLQLVLYIGQRTSKRYYHFNMG